MAKGVNKVILLGRLGQDPDVKYNQAGGAITNISIATSESWKDKQTGEQVTKSEWHRVVFFGRLAEIAGEYLKKGSQVYLSGSLRTRKYTDKNGVERYATEIIADELQMLGSRNDSDSSYGQHQNTAKPQAYDKNKTRDYPKNDNAPDFDAFADQDVPF